MKGKCPICGEQVNLVDLPSIKKSDPVICVNEDYLHVKKGTIHFMAHTVKNLVEETFQPSLVLC